jgi:hypothetical protein
MKARELKIEILSNGTAVHEVAMLLPADVPNYMLISRITGTLVEVADKFALGNELALWWYDADGIGSGMEGMLTNLMRGIASENRLSAVIAPNDMRVTVPI